MKLLAWDTSSKSGVITALEWLPAAQSNWKQVRLVAEFSLNVDLTHSERLLWGIHQVLEAARWKLEEVDYYGVGVGPGSFTGLRIGMTTARTLSHTFKKPLVGVSSLAALARPVALHFSHAAADSQTYVIAVTDACKGELFALWGRPKMVLGCAVPSEGEDSPGLWKSSVKEQVIEPESLIEVLQKKLEQGNKESHWIAVGEGRNRYLDSWAQLPASREIKDLFPYCHQVQGRYLGMLVWEAIQAGLVREGLLVHPHYLRASDAELKLKAGLLSQAFNRG